MEVKKLDAFTRKTKSGFSHGLINFFANSVKESPIKDAKIKEKLEKEKKRDEEVLSVRYINRKEREGRLERPYMKYAGDPVTQWIFLSNETYDVPRGLVEDVNKMHTFAKKRSDILDKDGIALEQDDSADIEHEFVGVI